MSDEDIRIRANLLTDKVTILKLEKRIKDLEAQLSDCPWHSIPPKANKSEEGADVEVTKYKLFGLTVGTRRHISEGGADGTK